MIGWRAADLRQTPGQLPEHTGAGLAAARQEADALTGRILELREAYYERDALLVSDDEYDHMIRRLEELERLFPELQSQDSPTQTVGRSGRDHPVHPGTARRADAEPGQRLQP